MFSVAVRIVGLAFLLFSVDASAFAGDAVDLTCAPSPRSAGRDPIVNIHVRIDGSGWQVTHLAASGAQYERSRQYAMRDASTRDGLTWTGTLISKPYVHMVGSLVLDNGVVSYIEAVRDDRNPSKLGLSRAICVKASNDVGQTFSATAPRSSSEAVSINDLPDFRRTADAPFSILITNDGSRRNIVVLGVLPLDAGERFRREVADHGISKHQADVVLNSAGGSLVGGLALGRAIREMRFDTVLETIHDTAACYSACAYAFLGGISRRTGPGFIGFHQFSLATDNRMVDGAAVGTSQELMMTLAAYINEMGVSSELLPIATGAIPSKIRVLTVEEANHLKVNFDEEGSMKQWRLEALPTGLAMKTESEMGSREAEIACATEGNVQLALRWNRNDYEKLPSKARLMDTSPKFTVNGVDNGDYSESVEDSSSSLVMRFVIPRKTAKALIVRTNDPTGSHFNAGMYSDPGNGFNNLMMFMPVENLSPDLDALLASCR